MATGGPSAWKLEVDWTGTGVFVDESAYVMADDGREVVITRGRENDADDMQPGVLTATLDNAGGTPFSATQVGRFTADNPLSPLWPNVVDDVKTRFSVTRPGGTSVFRHRGRMTLSTPRLDSGDVAKAVVPIQSVGMLGQISRVPLLADWLEQMRQESETFTVDLFPFDDGVSPSARTPLRNIGSGKGTGTIYRPITGVGSVTSETPEGIYADDSFVLKPSTTGIGPVVQLETSIPSGSVQSFLVSFRTADRTVAAGPDKYLLTALKADGSVLFSVRLKDNGGQTDLNLYDAAGTFLFTLYFGFAPTTAAEPGDDEWFVLFGQWSGGGTNLFLRRAADSSSIFAAGIAALDIRTLDTLVLGGLLSKKRTPGKQTQCVAARFGPAVFSSSTGSFSEYLEPDAVTNAVVRFLDYNLYCNFGSAQFGTRNRLVRRRSQSGRSGFAMLAELARTTGALIVESRTSDGSLLWFDADTQRSATVALVVDIEADADGAGGLPMRKGDVPSSVTASWPGGSVTVTDATRVLDSDSVETCAVDTDGARDVASARMNASRRLRLENLTIDLAGATNDLWATVMGLEVGARIRVNLGAVAGGVVPPLVQHYGLTFFDVYVVGWKEHYSQSQAYWVLDTVPADDPVKGQYGTGARSQFGAAPGAMTVSGGTCVGSTGTGTVVVTTASGPALTTTGYPRTLNWNGEHVTVSAPGGSTSPQTLTVTARAVNGTVARAHAAGEPVNIALPAAFAM